MNKISMPITRLEKGQVVVVQPDKEIPGQTCEKINDVLTRWRGETGVVFLLMPHGYNMKAIDGPDRYTLLHHLRYVQRAVKENQLGPYCDYDEDGRMGPEIGTVLQEMIDALDKGLTLPAGTATLVPPAAD